MTYRELLQEGVDALAVAGVEEASLDAWYLMERASGMNRARYFMEQFQPVADDVEETFREWIRVRSTRVPLQHILGDAEFMGLTFQVNEHVLIPRQDTEVLVEKALECEKLLVKENPALGTSQKPTLLDMCTGSGCIAVSLEKLGDFSKVTAVDISTEALKVAKANAETNQVQVDFVHSDLFSGLTGSKFHMIVSNPPYIPTADLADLMPEVRDHDPGLALDGGDDGLDFYRILAERGKDFLHPGGYMLWEIGCEQAADTMALLKKEGYEDVRVVQDLTGKDRVVYCRKGEGL